MQRIYDSPDDRRGQPADSSTTSAVPGFDLREQVAQRPWLMLGAAVAAGFLLGEATGGREESYPRGPQLRDLASEVAMLPHGAPVPRGSTSGESRKRSAWPQSTTLSPWPGTALPVNQPASCLGTIGAAS